MMKDVPMKRPERGGGEGSQDPPKPSLDPPRLYDNEMTGPERRLRRAKGMLATGPVRWYATEKAMVASSKRSLSPKKASPDLVSKNSASRKNKQQAIKNSQKTDPRPTRIKKTSASNSAPYECNCKWKCTMEGPRGKGISHL
jgi:hypothetical protein